MATRLPSSRLPERLQPYESTSFTATTGDGHELLEQLHHLSKPLPTDQIDAIVYYLQHTKLGAEVLSTDDTPFESKDIGLGEENVSRSRSGRRPTSQSHDESTLAAEHFDQTMQSAAFEFVLSDHRIELKLDQARPWIRIGGIGRGFYHYQLYAAFWLLVNERGVRRGALLADSMGLGKTTTALLYIYLNYVLVENDRDVRNNPTKHLPSGVAGMCPSQAIWPVVCSCVAGGVTARLRLAPRPGCSLILAPSTLLDTWAKEWTSMKVDTTVNIKLSTHHGFTKKKMVSAYFIREFWLQFSPEQQTNGTMRLLEDQSPHHYIILTSVQSYSTWVMEFFEAYRPWRTSLGTPSWQDLTDGLAWARVIHDEAHVAISTDMTFSRIMDCLVHNDWTKPNYIAITATPFLRKGLADLEEIVNQILKVSPDLSSDSHYAKYFDDDGGLNLGRDADHALQDFGIRRRNDTWQNEKPLGYMPPLRVFDVLCPSTQPLNEDRLEILEPQSLSDEQRHDPAASGEGTVESSLAAPKSLHQISGHARILASIPGLARFPQHMWTWKYISQQGWHLNVGSSPFASSISELHESSGKLQMLATIFGSLGRDAKGQPEKLVIITEYPVIALTVAAFCLERDITHSWIHAAMKMAQRESIVSTFNAARDAEADDSDIRVLVGTRRIVGIGLNLTGAFRVILVEPFMRVSHEDQAIARIHRVNTQSDCCWAFRLYTRDSATELAIMTLHSQQLDTEGHLEGIPPVTDTFLGGEDSMKHEDTADRNFGLADSGEKEDVLMM